MDTVGKGKRVGEGSWFKDEDGRDGGVAVREKCCSQVSRAHIWSATTSDFE